MGYADPIPVFAVGYTGWSKLETLKKHIGHENLVNGVLVIEGGLFASNWVLPHQRPGFDPSREWYAMGKGEGPMALWAFFCTLQQVIHGISDNCEWIRDYAR
jgi:hypothetical protein